MHGLVVNKPLFHSYYIISLHEDWEKTKSPITYFKVNYIGGGGLLLSHGYWPSNFHGISVALHEFWILKYLSYMSLYISMN